MRRERPPRRAVRGGLLSAVLCAPGAAESSQVRDFVTVRWYGEHTDRFELTNGWPENATEVCLTFQAICVNIRMGECVKMPEEFKAPYSRDVEERDASNFILDPPREVPDGYMMITGHEIKHESNDEVYEPRQLFSGCSRGCLECAVNGTGKALHPLPLPEPICQRTNSGGAFAILYNRGDGSANTRFNCIDSLEEYYRKVRESGAARTTVTMLVLGSISAILVAVVGVVMWRVKMYQRQVEAGILQAIREGRAQFVMANESTVSQEQIEAAFPIVSIADEPQCVVCISPVEASEPGRRLQCGHEFHGECILKWWMHRPKKTLECPHCRQEQKLEPALDEAAAPPEVIGAAPAQEAATAAPEAATAAPEAATAAPETATPAETPETQAAV